MNDAGNIAGTFINAFAVNEGAIVHVLSGTMTMRTSEMLDATRRASIYDTLTVRLYGSNAPHRRVKAPGYGAMILRSSTNASQRHAARLAAALRFKSAVRAIRRQSAPGTATLHLRANNGLHARRVATALGTISIHHARAKAVRRQRAPGSSVIRFLHLVNLRAFAPIYGKGSMRFRQSATAVRRVGLPATEAIRFMGIGNATARRQFSSSDAIKFLSSIRMPHARMTPNEEIRFMQVLYELRAIDVPQTADPIRVMFEDRELVVPESFRNIGNPDNEDPA